MYGTEFRWGSHMFGLFCGRLRCRPRIITDASWYNKEGEKLGWGDLVGKDFHHIRRGLKAREDRHPEIAKDEIFVVLDRWASYWDFVASDDKAPGVNYVAAKAVYFITKDGIFTVRQRYHDAAETEVLDGATFKRVDRWHLWKLMTKDLGWIKKTVLLVRYLLGKY